MGRTRQSSDYVKSMNEIRRQFTASQRSMVAARMKPLYEEEAKARQEATRLAGKTEDGHYKTSAGAHGTQPNITGRTNEIVGKMMGVSEGSVKRASRVIEHGTPELINAVDTGEMSVRKAAEIAGMPKEVQKVAIEEAKVSRKEVSYDENTRTVLR